MSRLTRLDFKQKTKDGYEISAWRGANGDISFSFFERGIGQDENREIHILPREVKKLRDFLNKSLYIYEQIRKIK